MAGSRQIRSVRWCSDDRMTTGKKQPRVVEGSTAGEQGSEAAVGSTHTNPYLFFLDAYQKKAKAASTSRRFKIAQCSKPAADIWNNMSDAERAPFVEMAKERKARMKKPIPKGKKKKALPVFRSRCSPLKLVKVNKALTKAQRDAVKGLGFGSMLQLKCTMLSRDFINRLVKHFNPVTRSLEFGRARVYRITADDVERALGLSCGTIPVPTDCQDRHVEHITNMFKGKEEKELKRGVTFAMMQQVFDGKKHDMKFQTSYVLFVLSCFLCPTTKDVAATKFYPAVHDLKQTRTYAWAEFVLQWLAAEIAKYKKRSAKVVEGKKDSAGVAGCVLLLMLLYFDKHPMGMKVGQEGEPLIQSWTTKLIKERIAKEETLELVDPISERFPQPSYRHPYTNAAFHDLKKYFINQMQVLDVMDAALMGDVPETCTRSPSKRKASTKRKNRNEDDVEMGDVHMDVEDIPSTSTVNAKKVRHGEDMEDMDGSRMSGLLFAQNMPLYSPEHVMADVLQRVELQEETVVAKGDKQGEGEEHYEQEEDDDDDEEEDDEEEEEEEDGEEEDEEDDDDHDDDDEGEGEGEGDGDGDGDGEGDKEGEGQGQGDEEVEKEEQVPMTPPLNKRPRTRSQKSKSVTRPSTKRGTRTFKPSRATRTPYVAPPEVKLSKPTKQERQVWASVMQPPKRTGEEDYVFKMGGGRIHLSHHMLHEVFKPRGHMSTMVMTTMTEWLMKEEKAKAPIKDGVPRPSRHMFSSYFVLFLPVLLTDIEHWYCVVVNLVDKRIEVLDSMALQSTVKKVATVTVVSTGQAWHDCGFYTLKFMEHWTGGRMNTRELEDHVGADPIDVRKKLLVRLLLSPHNLLRDVVVSNFVK
ncbi:hypothetical protein RHMOL_Rhmol05G0015100 [Rhododendron molle]|uniref:Uncharacterized protein n=1 Tax=Rhododendron molle TaxID=49168 RepID=A0ACC0NKK6_RHOML|nr:hypothetical protein RHMOL_Rhmol05G0015100 [Rhododendron molle]